MTKHTLAPWRRKLQYILGGTLLVAGGASMLFLQMAKPEPKREKVKVDIWLEEREKQSDRWELILDLIKERVFEDIDVRDGTITVGSEFLLLPFEQKQTLTNVVWSYYSTQEESEYVTIRLKESLNGKEVGRHSQSGLTIY